jgi:L-amino acid N-acyltransferase YncA
VKSSRNLTRSSNLPSMITELQIRQAKHSDAFAIAKVHVAVWQSHYRGTIPDVFLDNLSVEKRLEHWEIWLTEMDYGEKAIFVAQLNEEIIGFVSGGPCRDDDTMDSEFYAIYVLSEHQGVGAGKALLNKFLEWCKTKSHQSTCCWVLENNASSCKFYERMGGKLSEGMTKTLTFALKDVTAIRYVWQVD